MTDTMIGVDLAKRVFQVHGASVRGDVKFRRKLTREQFRLFMAQQAPRGGVRSLYERELLRAGDDRARA